MTEEPRFEVDWPSGYEAGDWIGVRWGSPIGSEHAFEIRLRYTPRGELQCAGLLIGEHASQLYRYAWRQDERPITRRMVRDLPVGAVLTFISDEGVHDPVVRENLQRSGLPVGLPAVTAGASLDELYVQQAERFAVIYRQRRRSPKRGSADVYERLAKQTGYAESTVRVHVRKGWELAEKRGLDLKPQGVRTRITKTKEDTP